MFQNIFTIQTYLLNYLYLDCGNFAPMNSKSTLLLSSLIFFLIGKSFAQNEANIWYFGNYGGVDFNSGLPVVLTYNAMPAFRGWSSIPKHQRPLLFFTD